MIYSPYRGINKTNDFINNIFNKFKYNEINTNFLKNHFDSVETIISSNISNTINNSEIPDLIKLLKTGDLNTFLGFPSISYDKLETFINGLIKDSNKVAINENLRQNNTKLYEAIRGNINRLVNECVLHTCHGSRGESDKCFKAHWYS